MACSRRRTDKECKRRRTQIRLAQRAYRQRKETTLDDLRKNVSDLQSTISTMQHIFLNFSDSCLMNGDSIQPNLSESLKTISDQYAKLVSSAYVIEEEPPPANYAPAMSSAVHADHSASSEATESPSNMIASCPESQQVNRPSGVPVDWNYSATIGETQIQTPAHATLSRNSSDSSTLSAQDRSSQQFRNDSPHDDEATIISCPLSRTLSVKSPFTYSFQETSLARRLHRATCEEAYHLACNPMARPQIFNRAFALTMKYAGTVECLQEHFATVLKRGVKESLHVWGAPFIHIGGAGTHYPREESSGDWTERPNVWNVRSIGPQNVLGEEGNVFTPEDALQATEGFEGIWFDAHDVEGYLAEKGVFIDPQTSYADITISVNDLVDSNTPELSNASTPTVSSSNSNASVGIALPFQYQIGPQASYHNMQYTQPFLTASSTGYSHGLPGAYMGGLAPSHSYLSERSTVPAAAPYTSAGLYTSNPAPAAGLAYMSPEQSPQRTNVTIDVAKFIQSILRPSSHIYTLQLLTMVHRAWSDSVVPRPHTRFPTQ